MTASSLLGNPALLPFLMTVALLHAGCVRSVAGANQRPAAKSAAAVVMRRQVLNAAETGESDPVAGRLRAQIAAAPQNVEPRLALARHYESRGLRELQLEHLRLAVDRFPGSLEARRQLGRALRQAGLVREAAGALSEYAARPEASPDAALWNLLGMCYDGSGDWKAGEESYRKALALAPEADWLHNNLGYNLLEQGRTTEAVAAFEAALKRNRASVLARNNLGLALARTAAVEDAVRHFENVTDASTAYSNAAAALLEQRRYPESRRLLETALDYNPRNAAALANLQLLAEQDGQPAEVRLRPSRRRWRLAAAVFRAVIGAPAPKAPVEPPARAAGAARPHPQ